MRKVRTVQTRTAKAEPQVTAKDLSELFAGLDFLDMRDIPTGLWVEVNLQMYFCLECNVAHLELPNVLCVATDEYGVWPVDSTLRRKFLIDKAAPIVPCPCVRENGFIWLAGRNTVYVMAASEWPTTKESSCDE